MPLHKALLEHNSQVVIDAIKNHADIHEKDRNGLSLLQIAAREGLQEVVLHLLNAGASIDGTEDPTKTPILLALENGHEILVEILLACGAYKTQRTQSYAIQPSIVTGLLFWAIRNTDDIGLLSLLQKQIEAKNEYSDEIRIDIEEKKEDFTELQSFLQNEISSFLKLSLTLNKKIITEKILEIATNIHANYFGGSFIAIPILTEGSLPKRFMNALDRKDYTTLHTLLESPNTDIYKLLLEAVELRKKDNLLFLLTGTNSSIYSFAKIAAQNPFIFQEMLVQLKIEKSLLHQVVSHNVNMDVKISNEALQLFTALPQNITVKTNKILACIYDRHADSIIAELLTQDDGSINERIKKRNLPLAIHALLSERFLRFEIILQPNLIATLSHDQDLPNVLWQCVFINLNKDEQKNVNRVSRHFHQLIIDPQGKRQRTAAPLQRKLHTINVFIEQAEDEIATFRCLDTIDKKDMLVLAVIIVLSITLGLSVNSFIQNLQIHSDLVDELNQIQLTNNSTCDTYYGNNGYVCDVKRPSLCEELCHEIALNISAQTSSFVGIDFSGVTLLGIFIMLSCIAFYSKTKRIAALTLDQFSETMHELATAMFAENARDFFGMTLHTPIQDVLTKAKQIKTALDKQIHDILLEQEENTPSLDLQRKQSVSSLGLFSHNHIRSLDDEEIHAIIHADFRDR